MSTLAQATIGALGLAAVFLVFPALGSAADDARRAKQAELDRICQEQRAPLLRAEQQRYIDRCIARGGTMDRGECERYFVDFSERGGPGAGMFYDLPACVAAFDYSRGSRRPR